MATSSGGDTQRALVAVAAKVAGAALGLALNVVVARMLSVEDYGLFLLGLTLALLMAAFSSAGLPLSAVRYLPKYLAQGDHRTAERFKRICIRVTWAGSLVVIGIGLAGLWLFGGALTPEVRAVIMAAAPVMLIFSLGQSYSALLQARLRVTEAELIFNTLRPALAVAAILTMASLLPEGATPSNFLWLVAASAAIALVILALYLRQTESTPAQQPPAPATPEQSAPESRDDWRQWLSSGAAILLILSGAALNERLDILMVSALAGTAETAVYGAASRFAVISMLVVSAVGAYFLPRFSAAWASHDTTASRRHAVLAARTAGALALTVLAVLAVFGPFGLALFGPEYRVGQATMLILAAAFLCVATIGQGSGIAVLSGNPGVALRATGAGLAVNIGLNLLLTPRFGSEGAATATLFALSVTAVYSWYWCRRSLGFSTSAFGSLR